MRTLILATAEAGLLALGEGGGEGGGDEEGGEGGFDGGSASMAVLLKSVSAI